MLVSEVDYILLSKEQRDFDRAQVVYRTGGKGIRTIATALGIIIFLTGLTIISDKLFAGSVCVAVGAFLFLRGAMPLLWMKAGADGDKQQIAVHLALKEDGLLVRKTTSEATVTATYPWPQFSEYIMNEDGAYIIFFGKDDVWIPNTAFSALEHRQAFFQRFDALAGKGTQSRSRPMRVLLGISKLLGR